MSRWLPRAELLPGCNQEDCMWTWVCDSRTAKKVAGWNLHGFITRCVFRLRLTGASKWTTKCVIGCGRRTWRTRGPRPGARSIASHCSWDLRLPIELTAPIDNRQSPIGNAILGRAQIHTWSKTQQALLSNRCQTNPGQGTSNPSILGGTDRLGFGSAGI